MIYARNDRLDDDLGGVPQLGDHIHQAFGVTICGEAQPPIPEFESDVGIHTHGDGVIHIHPFSQLGVGANATLGRFFEDARDQGGIEVELSDSPSSTSAPWPRRARPSAKVSTTLSCAWPTGPRCRTPTPTPR